MMGNFLSSTNPLRGLLVTCCLLILGGCAVGNSYNYRESDIAIPVSGNSAIGLAVVDSRPYVLDGDKPPSFIGLQRGGFGNPFNVTTESGRPLAEEVQAAIANGLRKRGYEVSELSPASSSSAKVSGAIKSMGLSRNILLTLLEWKTDAMARFALNYDLNLEVLGPDGQQLGTASSRGDKEILGSAGMEKANSNLAQKALEEKIASLFRDSSIQAAMQ